MKIKNIIASLAIMGIMVAGTAFAMPDNTAQSAQTIEDLSPEQAKKWKGLHDKHIKDMRPIRSDLQAKYLELRALKNNAKVTPEYISDLTKEIVALKNRIADMNEDFYETSKKDFNLDFSSMMNSGHGGMNMHGGKGMHDGMPMCCTMMQGGKGMHSGKGMDSAKMKNDGKSMKGQHTMPGMDKKQQSM